MQHRAKIVMRFKVVGIIFDVMPRQRLLQLDPRISNASGFTGRVAYRQNLQPQVGHLVAGAVSRYHTLGRFIGICRIVARIVVNVAHHNRGSLRELYRLGTTIVMRYIYDNSRDNSANPNDPPKRVVAGNRASDEMAHLWLQVLPVSDTAGEPAGVADPRIKLEEALARHHIENNPDDFEAHYNLGAMLHMRGETRNAAAQFAEAQRLRPGDATVENALGGALLAMGQLPQAIDHLSAAVKARPDYFDAHYNLGLALARHEDFPGAAQEFRAAVRLNPNDANAEANLGSALAAAGALPEAKTHLERALALNPQNTLARENLDQILQDAPH